VKTFNQYIDELSMTSQQKVQQMNYYWKDLDRMASDERKKKNMKSRFGIKNIKLDKKGNILSFESLEEAESWKSTGHYTEDGEEWKGDQHYHPEEGVMTGKEHDASSKKLYHYKDLTPEIRKKIDDKLKEDRDYKHEYKKFQSSTKSKKYRAELNKYNRDKGTYGNGDGKDASHKNGKIVGMEDESINRGRAEKSRLVGSKRK
jgi:hypothetical protein